MNEEQKNNTKKFLIALGAGFVALFLGALVAFYLVLSQFTKNINISYSTNSAYANDFTDQNIFNDIDRQFNSVLKNMPQHENFNIIDSHSSVKTEDNPNEYKVSVDLKPFGGDEKNVNIKIQGNRVIISATYKNGKDKNQFSSSSFYQSFSVPGKVDPSKIIKKREADILTVIVPKNSVKNDKSNPDKQKDLKEPAGSSPKNFI